MNDNANEKITIDASKVENLAHKDGNKYIDTIDKEKNAEYILNSVSSFSGKHDYKAIAQWVIVDLSNSPSLLSDRNFLSRLGEIHENVLESIFSQIDPNISNDPNFYLENVDKFRINVWFMPSSLRNNEEFQIEYSNARTEFLQQKKQVKANKIIFNNNKIKISV